MQVQPVVVMQMRGDGHWAERPTLSLEGLLSKRQGLCKVGGYHVQIYVRFSEDFLSCSDRCKASVLMGYCLFFFVAPRTGGTLCWIEPVSIV